MFDNSKYKNDLKIVVDNTNKETVSDVLIIESGDLVEDMDDQTHVTPTSASNQQQQQASNDVHTVEMQSETDDTEFHVNLDKVPLSLKNTVIGSKVYINDSFEKIKPVEKTIDDLDLKSLYQSLEIEEDSFTESDFNVNYYRRDALHLIGVDEMSTDEVFQYFNTYKPFSIEWISDNVCNVVWKDSYLIALALIEQSKPYEELEKSEKIATEDETPKEEGEEEEEEEKVQLPPGKWRVGNELAKKGNQIFMRFAKQSDRKIKGAESRSQYYRKYGNPNYGNLKGLISTSKKAKLKANVFKKLNGDIEEEDDAFDTNPTTTTTYDDRDTWGTRSSKEIMTRIRLPNDSRPRTEAEKPKRKMRMYIDDYDEKAASSSMKRKRRDDDSDVDDDSSGSESDHRDRRSRSPKVIRKPLDARSYLDMKKSSSSSRHHHHDYSSSSSSSDSKRFKSDLRDKLKHKHRR